jgi:hypothetical protein
MTSSGTSLVTTHGGFDLHALQEGKYQTTAPPLGVESWLRQGSV